MNHDILRTVGQCAFIAALVYLTIAATSEAFVSLVGSLRRFRDRLRPAIDGMLILVAVLLVVTAVIECLL